MAREVPEEESYRRADEESGIQKFDKMSKVRKGEVKIYKGKEYIAIPEIEKESCKGCCFYDEGVCSIEHNNDPNCLHSGMIWAQYQRKGYQISHRGHETYPGIFITML